MAKVFLDPNDTWQSINNNTHIYGSSGKEKVIIHSGVSGLTLSTLVEEVELFEAKPGYNFSQLGNQIAVSQNGVEILRIPIQQNGTQLTFAADHSVLVTLDAEGMKIDGKPLDEEDEPLIPPASDKAPWSLLLPSASYAYSDRYLLSDGSNLGTTVYTAESRSGLQYFMLNSDSSELVFQHGSGLYSLQNVTTGPQLLAQEIATDQTYPPAFFPAKSADESGFYVISSDHVDRRAVITDGSKAGTHIIEDMDPLVTRYSRVDADNHQVWSTLATQPYGWEVFVTHVNPDSISRQLTKDINPGSASGVSSYDFSNSSNALLPDGRLVFMGDDGEHGDEPWVSDGTEAGTFMLADLNPGSASSSPGEFTCFNGEIAFTAYAQGRKMFFTDGTQAGTRALEIGSDPAYSYTDILGDLGGKVLFSARITTPEGKRDYVFSTDGTTTAQTNLVKNASILQWGENIAYYSHTDADHGTELWAYTTEADDFYMVSDILPGTGSGLANTKTSTSIIDDHLLFTAYASPTDTAWFISDGTEAGTAKIGDSPAFAYELLGNTLVYANQEGIYKLDLSATSITPVTIASGTTAEDNPIQTDSDQAYIKNASNQLLSVTEAGEDPLVLMEDVLKFKVIAENAIYAIQNSGGSESLWYSDGTAQGTYYVADLDYPSSSYDMDRAVGIKTLDVWQDEGA